MTTYEQLLLEKLNEEKELAAKMNLVSQEIEHLKQLCNLESGFETKSVNQIKRFYNTQEILDMSTDDVQDILNQVVTIKYIKNNDKERIFNRASFNDDFKNEFFLKTPSGSKIGNTKNNNMVCVIEDAEEMLFKNLIKDRIVSIEIH